MRQPNGQFAKGSTGNPNGRPKRADEQFLIDLWETHGQRQFSDAIEKGERWALKTLVDKLYPNQKPAETMNNGHLPQPILVNFDPAFDKARISDEEKEKMLSML